MKLKAIDKMLAIMKMFSIIQLFTIWDVFVHFVIVHGTHYGRESKQQLYANNNNGHHQTISVSLSYPTDSHIYLNDQQHPAYRKVAKTSANAQINHNDNGLYSVIESEVLSAADLKHSLATFNPLDNTPIMPNMPNMPNIAIMSASTCQTVCACKWKGGKQTVECIDRLLIKIPDNIDPSTQVLDMSGNKLHTLINEQFIRANLLNLQKLFLRNCKIVDIEEKTFKGLTNLVELDLSYNLLAAVPSMALGYISLLRDLTLSSNRIHKIESKAFFHTPALHKLDLSHCDVQVIAPKAFEGLEGLTLLRLNGNKLSELVPKTIETLKRLHGIELHDNPWMCDCRLRAAKLWLMEHNIPYPVAPVCAGGPERVIDQTFTDLGVNDFACKPEILPVRHNVEATMGENASILCRAKAIPEPLITWYWNGRILNNNTAFSSHQRILIVEQGGFDKISRLILSNAQEIDSAEFYCMAENNAGTVESNFTLHVRMRAAGMASLGSTQIVGLSAALVVLIVFILVIVLLLLVRMRREPYNDSKAPNHLEVITSINHQNMIMNKTQAVPMNGSANATITNQCMESKLSVDSAEGIEKDNTLNGTQNANPLQKPPRLVDASYAANNFDKTDNALTAASCFASPTAAAINNPDLINDTKRFGSDEFADLKISSSLAKSLITELAELACNNAEFERTDGCDSLYLSRLWQNVPAISDTSSADDLFSVRCYTDKTPIIDSQRLYDLHDPNTEAEFFSKTFPRGNFGPNPFSESGAIGGNVNLNANTILSANRLQGIECTSRNSLILQSQLSNSTSMMGGYPNDYGLPLVPGAELQQHHHHQPHHPHLQLHPYQNSVALASMLGPDTSINNTFSRMTSPTLGCYTSGGTFTTRTLPRQKTLTNSANNSLTTSPAHSIIDTALTSLNLTVTSSNLSGPAATPSSITAISNTASTSILSPLNTQNLNAKTIRVWQKGGVPVLPPVTALKRALSSTNRNSPDEGYQEGCGTDV